MSRLRLLLAAFLLPVLSAPLAAQTTTSLVVGTVTDAADAAVSGASV
jgi:hypothetical protein